MFVLFLGCGRVGDEGEVGNIRTFSDESGVRSDFDIIRKSQFIQNSNTYVKQGHYSLLFKYSGDKRNLSAKLYENGSKQERLIVKLDMVGKKHNIIKSDLQGSSTLFNPDTKYRPDVP